MGSLDSLQTFSELSIALVGFAGIVTAIKGMEGSLSGLRKIQMSMLFGLGMGGIVFAVFPQMLLSAQLDDQKIWRYSSAALLFTMGVIIIVRFQQMKKASTSVLEVGYAFYIFFVLQFCAAAANIYLAAMWLYLFLLLSMLINGLVLFAVLLRSEKQPV